MKWIDLLLVACFSFAGLVGSKSSAAECFKASVAVQPGARRFLKNHSATQALQLKFEEQKCAGCTTVVSGTLSLSGEKIVVADICTMETNPVICGIVDDGGHFAVSVSPDGHTAILSDYARAAGEIETVKTCADERCATLDLPQILTVRSVNLQKSLCK